MESNQDNGLDDQVFATLFIRAADEIRQFNKLREDQFRLMSRAHNGRGREHFVYRALVRSIVWGEKNLDIGKCWYLKKPKLGGTGKKATISDIFPKAIALATKLEKTAMGLSYGLFYGDYSQAIHLQVGQVRNTPSTIDLKVNQLRMFYLCFCCIRRLSKLCGIRARKGALSDVAIIEKGLRDNSGLFEDFTKPDISKGDFVVTGNALCEVLSVSRTIFGYRSFKLKYLSKPPIPDMPIDWFPAHQVRMFASRKEMQARAMELLTIDGIRPDIPRRNARRARQALREAVLSTWELITKSTR